MYKFVNVWIFFPLLLQKIIYGKRTYVYEVSSILLDICVCSSVFSLSLFLVFHIEIGRFFFHMVASNPSRGLLTWIEDRSPFGATTWEKRRTKVLLVFHIETTARASSEHFFAKSVGKPRYYRHMQLTNYIDDDSRRETRAIARLPFLIIAICDVVISICQTYWEI